MNMRSRCAGRLIALVVATAAPPAGGETPAGRRGQGGKSRRACGRCSHSGCRVNAPEADGTTALHWACAADDVETVRLLLRAGADAKAANRYGVTPLALAATNGNPAIVEALLEAGARPERRMPKRRDRSDDGGAHRQAGRR